MIVCGAPVSTSAGMDTPFTVTPTASSPHGSSFSANDLQAALWVVPSFEATSGWS